ncbi:MAG TPA: outer membrane protein assembly factor BamA [Anaerohalosphaeraceae bacterium]|jgi:outer membrane protein insertion porin family|nr:outer membrane protein assembly factor BamA [Anaerohalosphaeraceae bacterium]HRT49010.1 outer membrane protein assembly factor BamA [Anaerohalosphaeraceae bacterium]HRT85133.1 outer membrane protein assembly factor BamA [Anaerohalosphaeraceae bacterium]
MADGSRSALGVKGLLVLFALLWGPSAVCRAQNAQPDAASLERMTIGAVEVQGNVTVSRSRVVSTVRARPGQLFDAASAAEDARRIAEIDAVEYAYYSTEVVDGQVKLTFVVVEKNLVRSITFVGNEAFNDAKLLKELSFREGDYLDAIQINSGIAAIRQLYLKKGFPNVNVSIDNSKLAAGQVVFMIDEGTKTVVKDVNFIGNTAFTADELLKAMKTKPRKYLFWPVVYNAEDVASDEVTLKEIYQKRGYLDVSVTSSVQISEDGRNAFVTFIIDEGPVYVVEDIILNGNEYFSDGQLIAELRLKIGDFYSQERAEADVKHLRQRFRAEGFVDATVNMERTFVGDAKVRVVFTISQGERYRIGRIDITGNEMVQDKVIRRILDEEGFTPGEWFNADLARGDGTGDLEKLLRRMVYTESASIEATTPTDGRRNAQVSIVEGKTGSVMLGAGIASDSGIIGQFTYDERNFDITDWPESWTELIRGKAFRGAGQRLRISLNPGTEVSTFLVSFTEPYLYDKPISLETAISGYERGRECYDEERLKGYLGFEKRYPDNWRRGFSFRLEEVDVADVDFDAPVEIKDVRGSNTLGGIRIFVRRDTTDNRFLPTRGYHFDAGYEQVVGDFTFGILEATQRWYRTLYEDLAERRTVLELKLYGGTILGDAPPFEKFYAGGTGSLRGFEYRGISPRGLQTEVANPQRECPIGSDWIVVGNAEIAVPLASDVFSWLVFTDAGLIDSGGVRASVGTGLQIMLPQWFGPVPMRFELAAPVLKEDEDETRIFSFSVGALF